MAIPAQFRQYLIAQDEEGNNIEVSRANGQVGVLAFDIERLVFVHCHVFLEPLKRQSRFEATARKIMEHNHRSRARLFEFGEDEGNAFYITEHVDGETLQGYLSSQAALPVWLAMQITVQVLEAMSDLLEMDCHLPTSFLEMVRVWQNGHQSIRIQVSDLPMAWESQEPPMKTKQARLLFIKEAEELRSFFTEHLQSGSLGDMAMVDGESFLNNLAKMLDTFTVEAKSGYEEAVSMFETLMPLPPAQGIDAAFSPRTLLSSLLPNNQEVARSVMQSVRVQSQKLGLTNPYVMRGTLMKANKAVFVEQVTPERMTGQIPRELLSQVLNLAQKGSFPNILPVVFLATKNDIECMAEPVVDGVSLSHLLEVRRSLDPFEIHQVLVSLNVALDSLEKSKLTTVRLRLEDIFLFTGPDLERVNDSEFLNLRLSEWPAFSVVLRAHPSLQALAGRGTNPATLLPLVSSTKKDVEPQWNGGWLAALSCCLLGLPHGVAAKQRTGIAEMDAILRLLEDELKHARKGSPSRRSVFLDHYAKEIEPHIPEETSNPGSWMELSGATTPHDLSEYKEATLPVILAEAEGEEKGFIGFAEALIERASVEEPEFIGGLRPMRARAQVLSHDPMESSWKPVHKEKPLWWGAFLLLGGSLLLGATLAHCSGRALWQGVGKKLTTSTLPVEQATTLPAPHIDSIELPVATSSPAVPSSSKSTTKLAPQAAPMIKDLDMDVVSKTVPEAPAKAIIPQPITINPTPAPATAIPLAEPTKAMRVMDTKTSLTAQLKQLRLKQGSLPPELRVDAERAAQVGDTEAMLALAHYHLKEGAKDRDENAAFFWYTKASKAGEAAADLPLAECYLQGWGVAPDYNQAVSLLNKAVAHDDARAKDLLAVCYARGLGLPRDDAKAFALASEAYVAGVPSARGNLGAMYLRGQGTPPDAERAVKLFEEGAKLGQADSMLLFAQSLEYGTGIAANLAVATQWYQQAAKLGSAEAANWCRKKGVSF